MWRLLVCYTDRRLPPTLARRLRWARGLAYAVFAGILAAPIIGLADAYAIIAISAGLMRRVSIFSFFLLPVIAAFAVVVEYVYLCRLRKRVRQTNYRLCPQCGFWLAGLPRKHTCPECGSSYCLDDVEVLWRTWF